MFSKVLIANRGEIACRVIRTCRAMGIQTVAVYSRPDAQARHVLEADEAVFIGEAEPHHSYLNIEKLLDAAKQTGAEAIHPGYGFLSERAPFAQAVMDAGLTWIGPNPEVIEQLGDKLIARGIMMGNNVPTIPGTTLDGEELATWKAQADELGYPLLIKAAAGGGGKGMRVVHSSDEFEGACKTAASEAKSAFGDDRVYLERFVENPRHIEVQVLADHHGNTLYLFERECSIQRRHQKIIEEAPSPVISPEMRQKMGETAVLAAKAVGYTNAGTVEFLYDSSRDEYYFLEVNTRLQVEHPITEEITGLDLVHWQLRVASGEALPFKQEDLSIRGHSFECRIYAEDPAMNFAPSPGLISYLKEPVGPGIRVDSGVYSGAEVSVYYDPILAKLVATGETRDLARRRMIQALKQTVVLGIKTGIPMMIEILEHEAFIKGELTTHFLRDHFPDWSPSEEDADLAAIAYVLDQLLPGAATTSGATGNVVGQESLPTPWQTLGNWRMGQ
jgi:acetyl-CoA carboxylase biotin carboxylase subunit